MSFSEQQKKTILLAEIAALIHDIGKFSVEFFQNMSKKSHTIDFEHKAEKSLREILFETEVPNDLLISYGDQKNISRLGDLLKWHHPVKDYSIHENFKADNNIELPLLIFLIMYADTIDSASSKGGAVFERKKKCFSEKKIIQGEKKYLHTPFGEEEKFVDLASQEKQDEFKEDVKEFQLHLAHALAGFEKWNLEQLQKHRGVIQSILKRHLSFQLADTKLPTNDVSLWQHSYSTAALFKAMLVRHIFLNDFDATQNGQFAQYKEHLGILGIQWNEDEFISRSYRAKEILGLRRLLVEARDSLRAGMETELCLGNMIYSDRNGIYFLVPSDRDLPNEVKDIFQGLIQNVDSLFNDPGKIGGGLKWQVVFKDIGLNILEMADVINRNNDNSSIRTLATGPKHPAWVQAWENSQHQIEICPRCGLRPKGMVAVVSGSEGDRIDTQDENEVNKICSFCKQQRVLGRETRKQVQNDSELSRKLLGIEKSAIFWKYDIDDLLQQENEEGDEGKRDNRLALIQGTLDLRWMTGGYGFSSILGARPADFSKDGNDKSLPMETWEKMLGSAEQAWVDLQNHNPEQDSQTAHTLQQILRDTYFFTKGDGRAPGASPAEKARNFIENVVLNSPYDPKLVCESAKLVNYALRQHPAPSRLTRVWEQAEHFMNKTIIYCEKHEIPYSPLGQDATTFLLLVSARDAWGVIRHMQEEYQKTFGRVRHLLPFHLSSSVFYHKSPLYISVDAARRFKKLALAREQEWWTLKEKTSDENEYRLKWSDGQGREILWKYPRKIPAGDRDDQFYSWFWVDDVTNHPVHISELEPDMKVLVHPSTFDYEILDASTRRYDIRLQEDEGFSRPHYMLLDVMGRRPQGPRPYPLSVIEQWAEQDELTTVPNHQRKQLVEHLAQLHQTWDSDRYKEDMEGVAKDALCLTLGKERWEKHQEAFTRMAMDGSFFDLLEWQDFIRKMEVAE